MHVFNSYLLDFLSIYLWAGWHAARLQMSLLLYRSGRLPILTSPVLYSNCKTLGSASPSGLGSSQGGPDNIARVCNSDRCPPGICKQAKMQQQLWPLWLCRVRFLRGERDCCSGNESSGLRCFVECSGRRWRFKTKILSLGLQEKVMFVFWISQH